MKKYDDLINKIDTFAFLALSEKEYGPYKRPSDGRSISIVVDDEGNRRTVSYPKRIMEKHLGRILDKDQETVDHIDGNIDNNNLDNLRVVPRAEHSGDDTRRVKPVELTCKWCQKKFERSPRLVRDKASKNKAGPFCSRMCAGKYSRNLQLKLIDKFDVQPMLESEYYKRKNIEAVTTYLSVKYGQR